MVSVNWSSNLITKSTCIHNNNQVQLSVRQLQYDSLFPLSSESLGHAGRRFIIHYSLSLYVLERHAATLTTHAKATVRQRD